MIKKANIRNIDVIEKVYNKVTLELLRKEINQWEYPWKRENIKLMISNMYLLYKEEVIVGCFVVEQLNYKKYMMNKNDLYLGKIAIEPKYQGKLLLAEIINYANELKQKTNHDCYLDCWAGNTKLKEVYKRYANYLGDFKEDNYYISIFKL